MKRIVTIATAALLSLPLFGAEKEKAKTAPEPAKPVADSPLVAAAKRSNRGAKKTIVITNDDLKTATGGHITTTTRSFNVYVPDPVPTMEMVAAENTAKARAASAEKAAKAENERKKTADRIARAAVAAEAGEDPYAEEEPAAARASEKKP